jgi:hypothetical protein
MNSVATITWPDTFLTAPAHHATHIKTMVILFISKPLLQDSQPEISGRASYHDLEITGTTTLFSDDAWVHSAHSEPD